MQVVIFGSSDHEEQAARIVATKAGCLIATATVDGIKCHAGNAYKANGYTIDENSVSKVMAWLNSLPSGDSPAYGVPARGFAGRVFTNVWMPS